MGKEKCVSPKIAVGTKGSAHTPITSAEVGRGKRVAINKRSQDKSTKNNNHKINRQFFGFLPSSITRNLSYFPEKLIIH